MKLSEILKNVDCRITGEDVEIKHLSIDSRNIRRGTFFICISGFRVDGHEYIKDAIEQGASAILVEKDVVGIPSDITVVQVENSRYAMAFLAANFYDKPQDKINLVGVTGTNGKTSVSFYMKSVLMKWKKRTGIIGTVETKIDNAPVEIDFATSTTPDTIELMQIIKHMENKQVDYLAMEVTSHALQLHKVEALNFDVAIFTNLTQDHLDLHGTMENYAQAKAKLFKQSKVSVINIDDEYGPYMESVATGEVLTYSIDRPSDLVATDINYRPDGVDFTAVIKGEVVRFSLPIAGKFSVYNALGVIGAAVTLGIDVNTIKAAFSELKGVPGRIQRVENDKNLNVIVDYAHTPDGLSNIISSCRAFTKGRVITVFGCGGDRDQIKRPMMGRIACELSDYTIITSDNPRNEDPQKILNEIEAGFTTRNYTKIEDRAGAIKEAVRIMGELDTVIIAGKGHENYQIFKDKTLSFDDVEVAKKVIGERA